MKMIGLTGGIASGKSTVGNILRSFGITVVDADELAHNAIKLGNSVYEDVVKEFGTDILNDSKEIDRKKLAQIVFADENLKKRLEVLIHAEVIAKIDEMMQIHRSDEEPLMVFEIPLLFEVGMEKKFDQVWVVDVDEKVQLERLMTRNNFTLDEARQRISAQFSLSQKREKADIIISNNGNQAAVKLQVESLLKEFGV